MKRLGFVAALSCLFALSAPQALAQQDEETSFDKSSPEFLATARESYEFLRQKSLIGSLSSPTLGSKTQDEFDKLFKTIAAETPLAPVGVGVATETYDIVIQPGHYGRKTGATGASGKVAAKTISERALVAFVAGQAADQLRKKGHKVLLISADEYLRDNKSTPAWEGISAKNFIAIHADGSPTPCKTGPSLGYAEGTSPHAMHAIAVGMSQALGYSYADFLKDNFTAAEAKYYMFRHIKGDGLKGLLEIGEITCEADAKLMIENSELLAKNIAYSIDFLLSMPKE